MDIFSEIAIAANQLKKQSSYDPGDFILDRTSLLIGEVPPKMKTQDYLKNCTGFIYSCVTAIADEIGAMQLKLYKFANDGKTVEEEPTSEIIDSIYRANDFTTKFDMLWSSAQYLELTGEAPWFISYAQSPTFKKDVPYQMLLLRPDRLKVLPGKDGKMVGGYAYRVDQSKTLTLKPEEVVMLRYPDPLSQFRGKGTLEAAARTADIEIFAEEYNRKFFYNSARPDSQFVTDKKLTKNQLKNLEKKINKKYRGISNAHKTLILENGLEWKPMGLTQKDMDFIQQQKFSRDKIFSIFRVPKSVVAITDDVNRSNAEAGNYVFALRKIRPMMIRFIEQLNEFYVTQFDNTGKYFLDFEDPVPENEELKLKRYESGIKNRWLTPNEVRSSEGLEPIDGGDKVMGPLNLVEINGSKGELSKRGLHKTIVRSAYRRYKKQIIKNEITEKMKTKIAEGLEKKLYPIVRASLVNKANQSIQEKKHEFEAIVRQIHTNYEKKMVNIIKGVFEKQRKEMLGRLPKKAINPKDYIFDVKEHAKASLRLYMPVLSELVKDQSSEAFDLLGIDDVLDFKNPAVEGYLKTRIYKFGFDMTKHTNEKLGKALAQGVNEGEGIPEIRNRVSDLFKDMSKYRSIRIARTEITRATSFSHEQSYKESGVVDKKEWLTAKDERTCKFCRPMDGKTVKLGGKFFKQGSSMTDTDGNKLEFSYEDIVYPPLHANCRCTLIPVIK